MNKTKKNFLFVGFSYPKYVIPLPKEYSLRYRFRYSRELLYSYKYQGFMLVFNNNEYNYSIEYLDKKYRKLFNKFDEVIIYNKSYEGFTEYKNKWFKIYKVGDIMFEVGFIDERWNEYKIKKNNEQKETIKYNTNKQKQLNILFKYTKKYKTRKTSKIVKDLNMSERSIQRYMKDLNIIYHNVGYDESLNEWYFT